MKKNWKGFLLKGVCLTSVAFVFQACYGTGPDFGMDLYIAGQVNSKSSGLPIKGIKVSIENSPQYTYTDDEGNFSFYTEKRNSTKVQFEDIDFAENGLYLKKDTVLTAVDKEEIYLQIELEESK